MIRSSINGEDPACAYSFPFSWQLRSDIPLFSTCIRSHQIRTLWGFQKQVLSSSQFFMRWLLNSANISFFCHYTARNRVLSIKSREKLRRLASYFNWCMGQSENRTRTSNLGFIKKRNWVYRVFYCIFFCIYPISPLRSLHNIPRELFACHW